MKKDDVLRLAKGKATSQKVGSRAIPHRLNTLTGELQPITVDFSEAAVASTLGTNAAGSNINLTLPF
jgi:hypothetical protein